MLVDLFLEIARIFNEMAIYILFGLLIAGILYIAFPKEKISSHLGGNTIYSVIKASFIGVPLPLCSCGVIPTAISLYRQGASKGATASFLISTPQTGADSLLVTYSFMGPLFAVYRAIAAFVSGIVGGILVGSLDRGEDAKSPMTVSRDAAISNCKVCNEPENPSCEHNHTLASKTRAALRYGFIDFFSDIAGHILIGIVLAGVISYFLPDSFFSEMIGTGFVSMLLMIVVGIPLYMCSTASVPVAYAMMLKGVTPGAALVFLMVGPATNVVTISVVGSVMGKRTLGLYLATIAGTSIVLGVLLDLIYDITGATSIGLDGSASILPEWVHIAASILFALLMFLVFTRTYAAHRFGTDVDAASGSAACGCGSCGDIEGEKSKL